MRHYFISATCLLLASLSHDTRADTMYKCTDANGKIVYSDLACDSKAQVRTFDVTPPAKDAEIAARSASDNQKWKKADQESRERYDTRKSDSADAERREAQRREAEKNATLKRRPTAGADESK